MVTGQAPSDRAAARTQRPDPWRDLVEGTITAGDRELSFVHPREIQDLLDEEAFKENEYLPYWAQLWPSGIVLARAVSAQPPTGLRVLELGCGIGLPSIAATLSGGQVLATDWSSDAIEFTEANAQRNGATVETAVDSWAEPDVMVRRAPWDLVLAADVIYERRNIAWMRELLPRLVNESGEIWLTDPGRPAAGEFLAAAKTDWVLRSTADTVFSEVGVHRLRRRC